MKPDYNGTLCGTSVVPSFLRDNHVKEQAVFALVLSRRCGNQRRVLPWRIGLRADLTIGAVLDTSRSIIDRVKRRLETQRAYRRSGIANVGEVEEGVAVR